MSENYYGKFWKQDAWGGQTPNADELSRYQAIAEMIKTVKKNLSPKNQNFRILDLGCGRGWLTKLLSAEGKVLGVDVSVDGIQAAKLLFPELKFQVASSHDLLKAPDFQHFDVIISSEVIEHVPKTDQKDFIKSIKFLLKPGAGYLILTTPRGELWKDWVRRNPERQPVEDWITEKDLRKLCFEEGFKALKSNRAYFLKQPLNWKQQLLKKIRVFEILGKMRLRFLIHFIEYPFKMYQVLLLKRN